MLLLTFVIYLKFNFAHSVFDLQLLWCDCSELTWGYSLPPLMQEPMEASGPCPTPRGQHHALVFVSSAASGSSNVALLISLQ